MEGLVYLTIVTASTVTQRVSLLKWTVAHVVEYSYAQVSSILTLYTAHSNHSCVMETRKWWSGGFSCTRHHRNSHETP